MPGILETTKQIKPVPSVQRCQDELYRKQPAFRNLETTVIQQLYRVEVVSQNMSRSTGNSCSCCRIVSSSSSSGPFSFYFFLCPLSRADAVSSFSMKRRLLPPPRLPTPPMQQPRTPKYIEEPSSIAELQGKVVPFLLMAKISSIFQNVATFYTLRLYLSFHF